MTFNCDNIHKQHKELSRILDKYEPDLVMLQEIKTKQIWETEFNESFESYEFFFNCEDQYILQLEDQLKYSTKTIYGGTAIGLRVDTFKEVEHKSMNDIHERFQALETDRVLFICVYLPSDVPDKQDYFDQVYSDLTHFIEENRGEKEVKNFI